jgi:hypothetical protein
MLLTYFLNDFEMVPVAPIIIIIIVVIVINPMPPHVHHGLRGLPPGSLAEV